MLKKLTIGFIIATIVLFITTLIIVPFAVKQQINAFAESEDLNYNGKEFEIEVTKPLYQFVLKANSGVTLDESYDDKIHIDFDGIALGQPVVEAQEKDEKTVVVLDRVISSNAHKLLIFLDHYQEVTIYVPSGVKVDLLGDYYIRDCSSEVELDESEIYGDDYDIEDGNYYMYEQAARYSEDDLPETKIKKLTYAGYLMAVDYAQADLDKPMYIDYTMKLKSDLFDNAQSVFEPMFDYVEETTRKVSQAGVNYVDKQMVLAYALQLQTQNTTTNTGEEAQIVQREDGNYEIALPSPAVEQGLDNDLQIETLKEEVQNAREALRATLASNGVLQSEADYYLDLFKM